MITDNGYRSSVITRVIDGDTLEARVTLDQHDQHAERWKVRLSIVDTPERGTPGAAKATEFTRQFVGDHVQIKTIKDGGFGRRLGEVLVMYDGEQRNLSELLLSLGLATHYGR